MSTLRNTGNIPPDPDAIEEFRVDANNDSAEYGPFGNGVTNVITKSGTNQIHGCLFEFFRNTDIIYQRQYLECHHQAPPLDRN
jgi:hypothetical protein